MHNDARLHISILYVITSSTSISDMNCRGGIEKKFMLLRQHRTLKMGEHFASFIVKMRPEHWGYKSKKVSFL